MHTKYGGIRQGNARDILGRAPPPEIADQSQCTVYARVGQLIDGRDKWWPLTEAQIDLDAIKESVNLAISFLSKMQSREQMIDWLIDNKVTAKRYPPPVINLAILMALMGRKSDAYKVLADLQLKVSGPWKDRIEQVHERIAI